MLKSVNNDASGKFAGSFDIRDRGHRHQAEQRHAAGARRHHHCRPGHRTADHHPRQSAGGPVQEPRPGVRRRAERRAGEPAELREPQRHPAALRPHSGGADETVAASFTTTLNGRGLPVAAAVRPGHHDVGEPADRRHLHGADDRRSPGPTGSSRCPASRSRCRRACSPGSASSPLCPNAAAGRRHLLDDTTKVGTVSISAGTGSSPATLTGKIFLAEPIPGSGDVASLVVVVPAVVGPFNLGTVVSRAGLEIHFSEGQVVVTTTGQPAGDPRRDPGADPDPDAHDRPRELPAQPVELRGEGRWTRASTRRATRPRRRRPRRAGRPRRTRRRSRPRTATRFPSRPRSSAPSAGRTRRARAPTRIST